jgi:Glycosyl hydrolases family 43
MKKEEKREIDKMNVWNLMRVLLAAATLTPRAFALTSIVLFALTLAPLSNVAAEDGDAFSSTGFARAPEGALDIAHVPAPLFRDPVTNGAADPSVVWHAKEKAWYVFYTQRRANAELPLAESWYMGTKIGIAKSSDQGRTWSYVGTAQGLSRGMKEETFWAPHVFEDNGTWHMFVTFIPKAVKSAKGQPEICHYTSRDLVTWEYSDTVDVKSDDIIDPGVVKLRDGRWLMVFRDCRKENRTAKVVSMDLKNWTRLDVLTGDCHHEAPVALFWKNKFWLFIDEWKGIGVYESGDGIHYTKNNLILDKAGTREDDGYWGSHPGVALAGERAFVFYHVHAGRRIGVDTPTLDQKGIEFKRTSLQVAELELKDGKIVCERDKHKPQQVNVPAGESSNRHEPE